LTDINKITELARSKGILVHTDSVQSIGKTDFNIKKLNVEFATISAHKIYGPKGIGALYINENVKIDNLMHGGSQERNMRAGTENVPAIAGFKAALELILKNYDDDLKHYNLLRDRMLIELKKEFDNKFILNTQIEKSLPNILNISFKPEFLNIEPELLLIRLDMEGIAISAGSACTSGIAKPSRVLLEMNRDEKTSLSSIRISFGRYNKLKEVYKFVEILKTLVN
jgi:cysteine desulfurase